MKQIKEDQLIAERYLAIKEDSNDDDVLAGMDEADKEISHIKEVKEKLQELNLAQSKFSNALYEFGDMLTNEDITKLYKIIANKETISEEEEEFLSLCSFSFENFIDVIRDYQRSFDHYTRNE